MIKFDVPIIEGTLEFELGTDCVWRLISRKRNKCIEIHDDELIQVLESCILEELKQEQCIELVIVSMLKMLGEVKDMVKAKCTGCGTELAANCSCPNPDCPLKRKETIKEIEKSLSEEYEKSFGKR